MPSAADAMVAGVEELVGELISKHFSLRLALVISRCSFLGEFLSNW